MNIQNTDYDAAQALLDLQGNLKTESTESYVWGKNESRENMEKEAKLFWNCFISSDIPSASNSILDANAKILSTNHRQTFPKPLQDFNNKVNTAITHKENNSGYYKNCDNRFPKMIDAHSKAKPLPMLAPIEGRDNSKNIFNNKSSWKHIPKTSDIGTQTEERYFNPNIELMETTIKNLYERIQSLEARLKESNVSDEQSRLASSENEANYTNVNLSEDSHSGSDMNEESINNTRCSISYSPNFDTDHANYNRRQSIQIRDSNILCNNRVLVNHNNVYTNNYNNELVPIGEGHASVPARILKHINWNSYTSATRKLLTAVFSRRILATHSLTGKPSPAFPNKPAKKKLDQKLVNDIVQTVVERCSVPENVVRTSITTKCADESKMFKTRQRKNKKRSNKKDRENISNYSSGSESEKY